MLCPKPSTFTQKPNRRDELLVIAKRVEHLRMKIVVVSCEMVAQMLYPYQSILITITAIF
jgi:hypothetical protein